MQILSQFKKVKLGDKNIKIIVGLAVTILILMVFTVFRDGVTTINHKKANQLYSQNLIEKIMINGEFLHILTKDKEYKIYLEAINKSSFFTKYTVEVKDDYGYIFDLLSWITIVIAFVAFYILTVKSREKYINNFNNKTKQKDSEIDIDTSHIEVLSSHITFSHIAGMDDTKSELAEIIDFLRVPKKYQDLDIRLPKGILLVGPPGVGKTLIAKAVAGEAGVPFFYQSGASFVHIYVGMGAKRVEELFKKAKELAPSIIFIDEIDAVGKSRGEFRNDEREATLNQLLTEMDGFKESSGVIIIGATNKIEMLDEALLRAGRFDRHIHISLPNLVDRKKTIELYLSHKVHCVDVDEIAKMTVGFNSAALDTLTNEAALHAMREDKLEIETSDFHSVKDKVLFGKHKIVTFSKEEREIQAVYQGAKALIATWLDIDFDKIDIIGGSLTNSESEIISKNKLLARIKVYLAGSVATKLRYEEQFTNASSDILKAKKIAEEIIYSHNMGDNFLTTQNSVEVLLNESIASLTTLIKSLDVALTETTNHLLKHESINTEDARDIIRKLF